MGSLVVITTLFYRVEWFDLIVQVCENTHEHVSAIFDLTTQWIRSRLALNALSMRDYKKILECTRTLAPEPLQLGQVHLLGAEL